MEEKTLGQVAREAWYKVRPSCPDDWQAVAEAVVAAHEARRWKAWPDEEGEGEYPPDETDVEIYCGRWASKDRLIGRISKRSGVYGPSGASHWRLLPAPPKEAE